MTIEEKIERSGLAGFEDGYLGSTNHGVNYYCGMGWDNREAMNHIELSKGLASRSFDKDDFLDVALDEGFDSWEEWFNHWFGDCDDFEIIEDNINGGRGYGKISVDKAKKVIWIEVVPCLYNNNWGKKSEYDDKKIFGFDDDGTLVREISDEELEKILSDKDIVIG